MTHDSEAPTGAVAASLPEPAACETFHIHPDIVARLRDTLIGRADVTALAETFRLLGDGTRVRILDALSKAELCVCDLATLLDLSESAVSHQLRLLRSMRLVRPRREGRMVFYALDDLHIVGLFQQGLGHIEESPTAGVVRHAVDRAVERARGGGADRVRPAEEDPDGSTALRGNVE